MLRAGAPGPLRSCSVVSPELDIRDTLRVRENESPELAEAAPGRNTPRCPVTGLKCGADLGRATAVRGRTTGADGASRSRSA